MATTVLQQERQGMKLFFFSRMKLVNSLVAKMGCLALFQEVRKTNLTIRMFDVVHADIRNAIR